VRRHSDVHHAEAAASHLWAATPEQRHDPVLRSGDGLVCPWPHAAPPRLAGRAQPDRARLLVRQLLRQCSGVLCQQRHLCPAQNVNNRIEIIPNTLADLTKREWRFAHPVDVFPFDAARWGLLGLPTLRECSSSTWMAKWQRGTTPVPADGLAPVFKNDSRFTGGVDMWGEDPIKDVATKVPETYLAADGTRVADDVVLNNVIGFDVRVWDYKVQQYVKLGWAPGSSVASFSANQVQPVITTPQTYLQVFTYDTWSQSYENEGIYHFDNSGILKLDSTVDQIGRSTNGFDDNSVGIVDNIGERLTSPRFLRRCAGSR